MDKLVDLKEDRKLTEFEISSYTLNLIQNTKGLILILLNYDKSRQQLVEQILAAGIPCKVYLLGKEEPETVNDLTFVSYKAIKNNSVGAL